MAAPSSRPAGIPEYAASGTSSDLNDTDRLDVPHGADAMFTRATSSLYVSPMAAATHALLCFMKRAARHCGLDSPAVARALCFSVRALSPPHTHTRCTPPWLRVCARVWLCACVVFGGVGLLPGTTPTRELAFSKPNKIVRMIPRPQPGGVVVTVRAAALRHAARCSSSWPPACC